MQVKHVDGLLSRSRAVESMAELADDDVNERHLIFSAGTRDGTIFRLAKRNQSKHPILMEPVLVVSCGGRSIVRYERCRGAEEQRSAVELNGPGPPGLGSGHCHPGPTPCHGKHKVPVDLL